MTEGNGGTGPGARKNTMTTNAKWSIPSSRLELRFTDKKDSFDPSEAVAEANRCLYCFDAPCITACPTHIDIPTFIRKIATGNLRGSARTILQANLLGSSCSRVCPVEVLCEGSCVYVGWGRPPIEIGRLQRHAMDHARSPELLEPSGNTYPETIGLIGAGPASLACAGTLALLGYQATIYEKNGTPGGLNLSGVAPYKLRADHALDEVAFVESLGVHIQPGTALGRDVTGEELLKRHDAIFFGPGLGEDSFRGLPGPEGTGRASGAADAKGSAGPDGTGDIMGAVQWIERMKLGHIQHLDGIRSAVVIGGGNTALDVVQELAALGVENVTLVYRRGEEAMSGYLHEWEGARQLQVRLIDHATITELRRNGAGRLESILVTRVTPAAGVTRNPATVPAAEGPGGPAITPAAGVPGAAATTPAAEASEHVTLPCDLIIVATGQQKLVELAREFPGVGTDALGRVIADSETFATGHPRVFAGGDCRNGGKEVVNAVDEGQRAAHAIHRMLRGGH